MHDIIIQAQPVAAATKDTFLGLTPQAAPVVAACIAAVVGIAGLVVNTAMAIHLQRQKAKDDLALAEKKAGDDLAMSRVRAEDEHNLARARSRLESLKERSRRQSEFAEEALAAFYQAAANLRTVRSPGAFSYEAEAREGRDAEPEAERRVKDTYWPILKRMDEIVGDRAALHAMRFRAQALFGAEAVGPFMVVHMVFIRVVNAAQWLLRPPPPFETEQTALFRQTREFVIWEGLGDPDEIANEMAAAIASAERIFGRAIAGDRAAPPVPDQQPDRPPE